MSQSTLAIIALCGWVMIGYFTFQIRKAKRTGQLDIGRFGERIITRSSHPLEFPMWIYFMIACTVGFGILNVICTLGAFGLVE